MVEGALESLRAEGVRTQYCPIRFSDNSYSAVSCPTMIFSPESTFRALYLAACLLSGHFTSVHLTSPSASCFVLVPQVKNLV